MNYLVEEWGGKYQSQDISAKKGLGVEELMEKVLLDIYSWIKCLAIFYILLTMLIHLVPTGKYQRYVRFFMGLLLMVMLITPMLSILEKAKTLPESFSSLYQQEEKKRLTLDMENLQKSLLEKGVEEQLEKNIPESLKT